MPDKSNVEPTRPGGADAVCFTSGLKGAAFSAGVTHAWLASDREPPLVVAGISTGALSSAAMHKSYRELESAGPEDALETRRWTWFRRYLDAVTIAPLHFLWASIPDVVDFFADKPPVRDLSTAILPDPLPAEEAFARRHYFLLVKLGMWLAALPVRVQTVASIAVNYVRWKELGFPGNKMGLCRIVADVIKAVCGVWWHLLRSPRFYSERSFSGKWRFRPLFGWKTWLPIISPIFLCPFFGRESWIHWHSLIATAAVATFFSPAIFLPALLAFPKVRWWVPKYLFRQLDLQRGLLNPFELRRRLSGLFGEDTVSTSLGGCKEMHLLIVCAVLQQTKQVWPKAGVSLVDALSAALTSPGVFPPQGNLEGRLDGYNGSLKPEVVDGVVVRNNPIPAFFEWCTSHEDVAAKLDKAAGDSLYVVYSVPVEPDGPLDQAKPPEAVDIVESAMTAMELEQRRDTRQEVRQTNFLSTLEKLRRQAMGVNGYQPGGALKIQAGEIAPVRQISYRNEWEPQQEEFLQCAADGCRTTMETLYRDAIQKLQSSRGAPVKCSSLLLQIATRRKSEVVARTPGLAEVCRHCSQELAWRPAPNRDEPPPGLHSKYGGMDLQQNFAHLNGSRPRIVFLGNGGVFRGAFHIGVIGAMKATRVFPDLVIGASVGSLMGGALAAISIAPEEQESALLEQLASVFLNVDSRVALTRTLKNAAKQLGVRARDLRLSPAELRRMVLKGSQADAGYAATGAPPALIDALSRLFMIPHRRTAFIASEFVAGHVSKAIDQFLKQIRKETLESFEVVKALMGISLLEPEARKLLGEAISQVHKDSVQPYHSPASGKKKVSFFCTTSFLNARAGLLLGRDFLTKDPSYDFIYAALSSSAFPLVFAPRSEAEFVPGRGRTDRLFADGGIFDNLPFFPALEVLGDMQEKGMEDISKVVERIKRQIDHRDIFIAAGLDADPEEPSDYDTLFKIRARAGTLSTNSKLETFMGSAQRAKSALQDIAGSKNLAGLDVNFLARAISPAILKIGPTDKEHINPTFAFCKSAGMDPEVVRSSIADGCFRTLRAFKASYSENEFVHEGFRDTAVPRLRCDRDDGVDKTKCPHFSLDGVRFDCPFAAAREEGVSEIRNTCAKDKVHQHA